MAATTRSTRSCPMPTRYATKPQGAAHRGERPDPCQRSRRPAPRPARSGDSCSIEAISPWCRASVIPIPTARTSRAWQSGRPPGSTLKNTAAPAGSGESGPQTQTGRTRRGRSGLALYRRGSTPLRLCAGAEPGAASLERIEDLTLPVSWDRSLMATRSHSQRRTRRQPERLRPPERPRRVRVLPAGRRADSPQCRRCRELSRHGTGRQAPDDQPAREGRPRREGLLHVSIRL